MVRGPQFEKRCLNPFELYLNVIFQYRGTVLVITDGRGRSSFLSSRNLRRNMCPLTSKKIVCSSTLVVPKVLR